MSLNWNIEKVKDWENFNDEQRVVLDSIIWLTMAIGIGEITEDNHKEFFARLHMIEKLFGGVIFREGKYRTIKLDEVKDLIGLTTNVSSITRAQFNKNQLQRFYREMGV